MTERPPDAPELREVVADELGYDEVEHDPDQPAGPVPDDDREVPVPDELDLDEPDVDDFEGNLDA